ncbi:hypothetical protein [Immundisolibacter sp.]
MAKVVGKDLEFWWDGKEYPVISANLTEAFDTLETTDSSTSGDGKDFEVGRAARSFTIEANMFDVDGAEKTSGTLTAGAKYRLTGGTLEGNSVIGSIFVSNGTGTASSTNKCVPLGSVLTGKTLGFTLGGIPMPLMSLDISIKYDTLDVTDSSTSGDATESLVSRGERESKVSAVVDSATQDKLSTNPTEQAGVVTIATGTTLTGNVIIVSKEISLSAEDYAKVDYTFKWKGAPTEVNMGFASAVEKSFKIILKRGASTNKEYTGNAIVTEKTISSEVKGLAKISYTMQINGALSYAVAN